MKTALVTGSAGFVGIDAFTLAADQISVEINKASDSAAPPEADDPPAIDFSLLGESFDIVTGPDPEDVETIDFTESVFRASGFVTLSIDEFVHVSGNFAFEDVPYGAWYVAAPAADEDAEFFALAPRVELSAERPEADVTLRYERGPMIRGRVVDDKGAGVSGASMHSWNDVVGGVGRLKTGDAGEFSFGPMPPGTYTVEVWHEVFGKRSAQVTVAATEQVAVDFAFGEGE